MNYINSKFLTYKSRDINIFGRAGDPYFDNINLFDNSLAFFLHVIENISQKNMVIFDVGANIGLTASLMATSFPDSIIYAFEPDDNNFPYLIDTIKANRFHRCYPIKLALGAKSGKASFLANDHSGSASHLTYGKSFVGGVGIKKTVIVQTIDQFVMKNDIKRLDLIKIDVEGYELDVILGAKKTLKKFRPHVFLEFNSFTTIAYGNHNPRYFLEFIKEIFPHVYRFEGGVRYEITGIKSMHDFLHDNLVKHGCVNDLLCTY